MVSTPCRSTVSWPPHSKLKPLMVTVTMQDTPVRMEVDTGASLSLISQATLSSVWPETQLKSSTAKLPTYTGKEVTVKGAVDVRVKYRGQTKDLTLTIVDGDGLTLMGRDWLQHLKLDWATLNHISEADCSESKSLLNTHAALFSQRLGCIKGTTARPDSTSRRGASRDSSEPAKYPTP